MGEDTVFSLPRPGGVVEDDPLLCLLREGARRPRAHRRSPHQQDRRTLALGMERTTPQPEGRVRERTLTKDLNLGPAD